MIMRVPLWTLVTGAGVFFVGAFTFFASLIFVVGYGVLADFPHPYWQWWEYLWWDAGFDPGVDRWLLISAIPAAALPGSVIATWLIKKPRVIAWSLRRNPPPTQKAPAPIRGTTDNYGHARWMTFDEARRLWPGPDPAYGGVVVGEAYNPREDSVADIPFDPDDQRTWGLGGTAPLLVDPCRGGSTHALAITGSGGFKTTSAVSTLLTWTGSAIVLDPSAELGPMLTADRQRMKHSVFTLHPRTAHEVGFNALDWIDTNSPMAETDVGAVVEWICGDTPITDASAAFFRGRGKALVTCLLAHILWNDELSPELKNLRALRVMIVTPEPELRELLSEIHRSSPSRMARDLAGTLKGLVAETFSGAYANADECTSWLSNRAFAGLVSGTSFRSSDVAKGNVTVFIALPLKALQATPAAARTIVGALLNAAYEADGNVRGRILFLLDEAARLGPMSILATARDAGRKYGITLHLIYQSVAQIAEQWGEQGRDAWYEAATWRSYAAIKDIATARELSASIGDYGVLGWTEAQNAGTQGKPMEAGSRTRGSTLTYQEGGRALIRPEEVMHDLREDAAIVIPKKGRPLLCGRAIYFRRDEFRRRVAVNRFAKQKESSNA
jgi:type IV secretion system protein VirD4